MPIMDYRLEFADATSIGAAVATTAIGNVIDLGAAASYNDSSITGADIGDGNPVYLHVRMVEAATGTSSNGTIAFYLQEAATNTPASFSNKITLKSATACGTYVAGYRVYDGALPSAMYKQYLRLASTIATTSMTAGTVDAYISLDQK